MVDVDIFADRTSVKNMAEYGRVWKSVEEYGASWSREGDQAMATILQKELETYEAHKEELLEREPNGFVLIKDDRIIDTFESRKDALRRGYQEFKTEPFLIKEIVLIEVPVHFFSSLE